MLPTSRDTCTGPLRLTNSQTVDETPVRSGLNRCKNLSTTLANLLTASTDGNCCWQVYSKSNCRGKPVDVRAGAESIVSEPRSVRKRTRC